MRFTRRFEDGWVGGYVIAIGPEFFLLALVSDRIWFDGFECFRTSDVRRLQAPQKHAAFIEAALKKRGEHIPRKPLVNIGNIEEILTSANRAFPLVTIHREVAAQGACWIGRVLKVARGRVSFLEIGPDATWEEKPDEYKLREITRVGFGADYEDALHLVGGPPAS